MFPRDTLLSYKQHTFAVQKLVDVTQPEVHDQSAIKHNTLDPFEQRQRDKQAKKLRS